MDDGQSDDAPRFMVLYCSIMILLLAFFIILQSFASEQKEGLFYKGRGSFVRALHSFGLGRFFSTFGLSKAGKIGARYKMDSQNGESFRLSSDPELQAAREALSELKKQLQVVEKGKGDWMATVVVPGGSPDDISDLDKQQKSFFQTFAREVFPQLVRSHSAVGIGVRCTSSMSDGEEVPIAIALCSQARQTVLDNMPSDLVGKTRQNIYSFCRAEESGREVDQSRLFLEITRLQLEEQKGE